MLRSKSRMSLFLDVLGFVMIPAENKFVKPFLKGHKAVLTSKEVLAWLWNLDSFFCISVKPFQAQESGMLHFVYVLVGWVYLLPNLGLGLPLKCGGLGTEPYAFVGEAFICQVSCVWVGSALSSLGGVCPGCVGMFLCIQREPGQLDPRSCNILYTSKVLLKHYFETLLILWRKINT